MNQKPGFRKVFIVLFFGFAALLIAGCLSPGGNKNVPPSQTFTLGDPSLISQSLSGKSITLRPVRMAEMCQEQAFLVRLSDYKVALDKYNRWLTRPENHVADYIGQSLLQAGANVQAGRSAPSEGWLLETHVQDLSADYRNADRPLAVLRGVFLLAHSQQPSRLIRFDETQALKRPDSERLVAGWQQCLDRAMAKLVQAL